MTRDSPTDRGSRPSQRRRWWRVVVASLACAALGALLIWSARDLPRRWIEVRIAAMLDADVRLERLEITDARHFVLRGLEVRRPAWESRLERLAIERLDVEAPLRAALAGRFERLLVDGLDVRLVPPTRARQTLPASALRVGKIEIRHGRLTATSGNKTTRLAFDATVTNWGEDPTGQASLVAERVDLLPLLGVAWPETDVVDARASARMLRVEARMPGSAEPWRIEANADGVSLRLADRTVELLRPRLEATATRDTPRDALQVRLDAVVPGLATAAIEAELDAGSHALRSGRATLNGMDVATLLAAAVALPAGSRVDGRADLLLETADGESFAYELDATLGRVAFARDDTTFGGADLRTTARGVWHRAPADAVTRLTYEIDVASAALTFSTAETAIETTASRITCSGTLGPTGAGGTGDLRARWTLANGHIPHRNEPLPAELFPIDAVLDGTLTLARAPGFDGTAEIRSPAAGRLRAHGNIALDQGRPAARWRWEWSDGPELAALRKTISRLGLELPRQEFHLAGRPSARGTLDGPLGDPAVQGELTIEGLAFGSTSDPAVRGRGTWKLDGARASTGFSRGPDDRTRVGFDRLRLDGDLHIGAGPGEAWTSPFRVTADGRVDARSGTLQLGDTYIEVERLGAMQVEGRLATDAGAVLQVRVEPTELSRLRELSRPWIGEIAPQFTLQGSVASRLDVERSPHGAWQVRGALDLTAAGFASPDGGRVVAGAAAHGQVDLSRRHGGDLLAEASATLTGPVLLWGTLFGDYSSLQSSLHVAARREGGRWESAADWRLPDGVEVHGRLTAPASIADGERSTFDYSGSLDVADLGAFLDRYVRGPFEGSVPQIETLAAAGRLHIDLFGAVDDDQHGLEGALTTTDASFSGIRGETVVEGLRLDLPISLGWNRNADGNPSLVAGTERTGSVAYGRLLLAGLELPPLDARLIVQSDNVRLDRPLSLSLLDGHLELQDVALGRWSRPERDLRFGVRLDRLSLAALTRALDTFPLDGTLSGAFPAVRWTPERLQVDGGGTIQLFGGEVAVYDISGQDIPGRFPKVRFSARVDGLHLLDLTRTFDFGEVRGVVDGDIRDCELFAGTPVRCQATLTSVKTKGVPQRIGVKAIRNISILGAGPRVGVLDRGLQKFFDNYSYSRLGLSMQLDDDRFLLRGTERRGPRELFVKGRLPLRLDIVNAAPGQTVSFQTIMSRLQNLQVGPPQKKNRTPASAR